MKGLLLKDLINFKSQAKTYLILFVLYFFIARFSGDVSFLGGVIAILCAMAPFTAFAFDEKAKWDNLALTMPVSRKDLVVSKYIFGIISCTVGLVIMALFVTFSSGWSLENLILCLTLFLASILYVSIILPVVFKKGVEKARLLTMAVMLVPVFLLVLLSRLGLNIALGANAIMILSYLSPVIVAAIFMGSLKLSIGFYNKKEF